ncbi:hypothetical protein PR202_ga13781 [Eleusine coracana subsp. coracana]|uniref:FRIGIDA-like protein n=1 Tax=Eleusine coracana subsp. coracana TaxID=191504 RepID=A0AAV5CFU0_ELECO|nr:hypothetical protein QOZ80_3AG0212590 [Eleusine coracana subsp. coracana]GJM96906.1 hypothetical protein PR202_ga13781 [Eleusine coracana subsp. coracana]
MAAPAAEPVTGDAVRGGFAELERQQQMLEACTRMYRQLTDHFGDLERRIASRSDSLRARRRAHDARTSRRLDALRRRELSVEGSVALAVSRLDGSLTVAAAPEGAERGGTSPAGVAEGLASLCAGMDSAGLFAFVAAGRKEVDALRAELPEALKRCVDPAKFAMDAVSEVFPVDKRAVRSPPDLAWACVLILEAAVAALVDPDPEIGAMRPMVPRAARERARGMAEEWKEATERKGGVEGAKPADAHAFLQHVATFAVVEKGDRALYRRIVVSFSWRRQMPRLALTLGLEDVMDDIIEELITKGQQLDAVNFAYEAGLQEKFPPVPLLKSYLEDSQKILSTSEIQSTITDQSGINVNKKEQSALRAVIKCVEDHKLEAEFPLDDLRKQLEELDRIKTQKKKAVSSSSNSGSSGPANKRIRANNGGPASPDMAGHLTECNGVSSPTITNVSPSSHASYGASSPYSYNSHAGHTLYCRQSAPVLREPYVYPQGATSHVSVGLTYASPPITYPAYSGYNSGLNCYGTAMTPVFHQVYY